MDTPPPVPMTATPATEFAPAARPWTDWPTVGEILAAVLAPSPPGPRTPHTPEDI